MGWLISLPCSVTCCTFWCSLWMQGTGLEPHAYAGGTCTQQTTWKKCQTSQLCYFEQHVHVYIVIVWEMTVLTNILTHVHVFFWFLMTMIPLREGAARTTICEWTEFGSCISNKSSSDKWQSRGAHAYSLPGPDLGDPTAQTWTRGQGLLSNWNAKVWSTGWGEGKAPLSTITSPKNFIDNVYTWRVNCTRSEMF